MERQPLDFDAVSYTAFDNAQDRVDPNDSALHSVTPDFVSMCDLLSEREEFNQIFHEDITHAKI